MTHIGYDMRFLDRFAHAFGRPQAALLQMAGMAEGECYAEGAWVTASSGRRWLDCGSFGIHLLGHRHPKVIDAVRKQLDEMALSTRILGNLRAVDAAEAILAALPWELSGVTLCNTGAEAIETALKLAWLSTGRTELAVLEGCYHGKSIATSAFSTISAGSKLPVKVPVWHCPFDDLDALIPMLETQKFAALLVEPIQGEGGIRELASTALEQMSRLCKNTGTLFILDEVQTGMGRTGQAWGAEHAEIAPDIAVLGKNLGGGVIPVSAVAFRRSAVSVAAQDPLVHSSSFAGSGLAGAAAVAALEVTLDPIFLNRVSALSYECMQRVSALPKQFIEIVSVRGRGLMIGIEFDSSAGAGMVLLEAARRGLLLTFCLSKPTVLRFYPPGVISDLDIVLALTLLEESVAAVYPV